MSIQNDMSIDEAIEHLLEVRQFPIAYTEKEQDAFEIMFDVLGERSKAEKNEPLSPTELHGMDGQPVWCTIKDGKSFWALIDISGEEFCAVDREFNVWPRKTYGIGLGGLCLYDNYFWLAYRHQPKEDNSHDD